MLIKTFEDLAFVIIDQNMSINKDTLGAFKLKEGRSLEDVKEAIDKSTQLGGDELNAQLMFADLYLRDVLEDVAQ